MTCNHVPCLTFVLISTQGILKSQESEEDSNGAPTSSDPIDPLSDDVGPITSDDIGPMSDDMETDTEGPSGDDDTSRSVID